MNLRVDAELPNRLWRVGVTDGSYFCESKTSSISSSPSAPLASWKILDDNELEEALEGERE